VAHLQTAYAVDVISAIVVAQVAAPAMQAAGFGTILVTGGGFADHPIPGLATVSLEPLALVADQLMPPPTTHDRVVHACHRSGQVSSVSRTGMTIRSRRIR
jgi:hypothetical protein